VAIGLLAVLAVAHVLEGTAEGSLFV